MFSVPLSSPTKRYTLYFVLLCFYLTLLSLEFWGFADTWCLAGFVYSFYLTFLMFAFFFSNKSLSSKTICMRLSFHHKRLLSFVELKIGVGKQDWQKHQESLLENINNTWLSWIQSWQCSLMPSPPTRAPAVPSCSLISYLEKHSGERDWLVKRFSVALLTPLVKSGGFLRTTKK